MRPFSRQQPSNRQGEERSPRSPRPRLNRESVDRAWENGAPTQHADYRTRSTNSQAPRNSWRNNQQTEHSSAQNGRKPYGNRQDGNRSFDRNANSGYQDNRSRSFDTNRQPADTRRNEYRGNSGGFKRYGDNPEREHNNTDRPYGQRPPFRGQGQAQRRDYPQRDYERNDRPPRTYDRPARSFEQNDRPPRTNDRPARSFEQHDRSPRTNDRPAPSSERDDRSPRNHNQPTREFERDRRPARGFDRDNRSARPFDRDNRGSEGGRPPRRFERDRRSSSAPQRDSENPRWQSRPQQSIQQGSFQRQEYGDSPSEHFEGDYERFNAPQYQDQGQREYPRRSPRRPFQNRKTGDQPSVPAEEQEERHVTRLPDGRVLKGPRPAQRKNAAFWTDIAKETEGLVDHVDTPLVPNESETSEAQDTGEALQATPLHVIPASEEQVQEATSLPIVSDGDEETPRTLRKPRSRAASEIARSKKAKAKATPVKPRSTGPKPSRRGFKWPTS